MVVVTLDQMIQDELKNIDLNGLTVLSVVVLPEALRIVFEMPPTKVEFMVNDDFQYRILSVIYNGVAYDDPDYLAQFEGVVLNVITQVKAVEAKQRVYYEKLKQQKLKQYGENPILTQGRLEAILLREERIKEQEQQLDLKEQEIRNREKILYDKEAEIALKREEEDLKQSKVFGKS